jgi:hypothetical protein
LENELQKQKGKVQSLQIDLDNSEAVQRDFVKLSQSLQVMLTSKYVQCSLGIMPHIIMPPTLIARKSKSTEFLPCKYPHYNATPT